MKDEQGTNIINPETMKIIRNLQQKGSTEKQDRDYYINLMSECLSETEMRQWQELNGFDRGSWTGMVHKPWNHWF